MNNSNNSESDDNKCPICLENMQTNVSLYCNHSMCIECFLKSLIHLNAKCPLCRDMITESECILLKFNEYLKKINDIRVELLKVKCENAENILKNKKLEKKLKIYSNISLAMTKHVQSLIELDGNNINNNINNNNQN